MRLAVGGHSAQLRMRHQPGFDVEFVAALKEVSAVVTGAHAGENPHAVRGGVAADLLRGRHAAVAVTEETPQDQTVKLMIGHEVDAPPAIDEESLG